MRQVFRALPGAGNRLRESPIGPVYSARTITNGFFSRTIMTTDKCLFCNIYNEREPAEIVYKDDDLVIFNDIHPASKNHFLIVPKVHIDNAKRVTKEQIPLVENLFKHGKRIIEEHQGDIKDTRFGFHWPPFNSISHLHLHAISPASQMSFIGKIIFKEESLWFVTPQYVLERLAKL